MMSDVGPRVVTLLVENGYGPKSEIEGCSAADIAALESQFDVTLPAAYTSCMRHIGADPNGFRRGSEFTCDEIGRQREFAEKRIEENDVDFSFDADEFVFMGHQGYSFLYFSTTAGPDPPVYHFTSPDEPYKLADSFSEWLFEEIRR